MATRITGRGLALLHREQTIRERLATSDPANAVWQRDLAVSHQRMAGIAEKMGDNAGHLVGLRKCLAVLEGMQQRGMHLDPLLARVHEQLRSKLLGGIGGIDGSHLTWDQREPAPARDPETLIPRAAAGHWQEEAPKLLNSGQAEQALTLLRSVVFPGDLPVMDNTTPLGARVAFLHALMLAQNAEGFESHLRQIPEQDDARIRTLHALMDGWKASLTWPQRLGFRAKPPLPAPPLE